MVEKGAFFFWLAEVAVVNFYILYRNSLSLAGQEILPHLHFCRQLIVDLCTPLCFIPRPRTGRHCQDQLLERLHPGNHFIARRHKRKDCHFCSNRLEGECHLTGWLSGEPARCLGDYIKAYHAHYSYTTKQYYSCLSVVNLPSMLCQ